MKSIIAVDKKFGPSSAAMWFLVVGIVPAVRTGSFANGGGGRAGGRMLMVVIAEEEFEMWWKLQCVVYSWW